MTKRTEGTGEAKWGNRISSGDPPYTKQNVMVEKILADLKSGAHGTDLQKLVSQIDPEALGRILAITVASTRLEVSERS